MRHPITSDTECILVELWFLLQIIVCRVSFGQSVQNEKDGFAIIPGPPCYPLDNFCMQKYPEANLKTDQERLFKKGLCNLYLQNSWLQFFTAIHNTDYKT